MSQRYKTDTWTFLEKLLVLSVRNADYKPRHIWFYKLHMIKLLHMSVPGYGEKRWQKCTKRNGDTSSKTATAVVLNTIIVVVC